jgi:glycosyltransferase involved in cell wall biosynthesis
VIPTCVDTNLFAPRDPYEGPEFGLVYSGSLGTWYMTNEILAFGRRAECAGFGRTLYLTRDQHQLCDRPEVDGSEVRAVEPTDVHGWLRKARAAFFFIRPTPAKMASCPTKLGEALASGLPIVCNRGVGEVDELVEREGVGVLVDSFGPQELDGALAKLLALCGRTDLAARCRQVAERRFGLDSGVEAYASLYRELSSADA